MSPRSIESGQNSTTVRAGADDVDSVLAPAGTLRFRFLEARTGSPLAAAGFYPGWKRPWYEVHIPTGLVDLRATEASPGTYRPTLLDGVRLDASEPQQVELVMAAACVARLRLAPGQPPFPEGHMLFLIEADLWDTVHYDPEERVLGRRLR